MQILKCVNTRLFSALVIFKLSPIAKQYSYNYNLSIAYFGRINMELLLTIVSGGVIGVLTGIASTFITIHYQKKQFIFEKKFTKYSEIISSYQSATIDQSEEAKQHYVSNQKQLELIGTNEIIELSKKFYAPKVHSSLIRDKLVNYMRKDLKKYY